MTERPGFCYLNSPFNLVLFVKTCFEFNFKRLVSLFFMVDGNEQ